MIFDLNNLNIEVLKKFNDVNIKKIYEFFFN